MTEQVTETDRPDPTGAEVLVAVEMRAALRLRIVEVDHDQPVETDPVVEVRQEGIDGGRFGQVDPGRPGVGRVKTERHAVTGDAASGGGLGDVGQTGPRPSRDRSRSPGPLEDDRWCIGSAIDLGEPRARSLSASLFVPASTPAPRCEPMWTLTYRRKTPARLADPAARTPTERPKKSSSGPARLTR